MFLDYYGLREQPFGVTPDPRFLYFGASHREALASLYYGLQSERGFLALVAKPGMGKTTLLFHLLTKLRNSARTAFLFQTQCDSRQFLRSLMVDLGADCRDDDDLFHLQSRLNEVLIRESRSGKHLVLVVDEAQNLEGSVLETLRMLSNFETPNTKLMQIILAGQPQLATRLADAKLVQLRQRISIVSRLTQLTPAETADYIGHRLLVAGYTGKSLFTSGALDRIASGSEGIPRNINNLCFHALTLGLAEREKRIDASIVEEALADLALESHGPDLASEETKTDDQVSLRSAHSSQGRAKPRELLLGRWVTRVAFTARRCTASWHISRKVRGRVGAAAASANRFLLNPGHNFHPQAHMRLRRAGAGLLITGVVCAAAWLAFGGTSATSQLKERIPGGVKIVKASSSENASPSLAISALVVRSTRSRRPDSTRRPKVELPKKPEVALLPGGATGWETAPGQDAGQDFARPCTMRYFSIGRADKAKAQGLFGYSGRMSEGPRGELAHVRCASDDGNSLHRNSSE